MDTRNVLLINFMLMGLVFFYSCEDEALAPTSTSEAEAQSELTTYFTLAGNAVRTLDLEDQEEQIRAMAIGGLSAVMEGIESVDYKGAIEPVGEPWYTGWSLYDATLNGDSTSIKFPELPTEVIADQLGQGTGTRTLTNDKIWILDGIVFVNRGDVLTIEPGTIIQGRDNKDGKASSLIIARGAKIIAEGTAEAPIIFTFEGDEGNSSSEVRGKWGGLLILGDARLNNDLGINSVEGISPAESRAYFGGSNDNDNSGILRYVSIRHGGSIIGDDNEINGLTLGGVGSGTAIEYVEVFSNLDDGIEWFGGAVNGKHLISAFCGDDGIDSDLGYRGKNQFVIIHKAGDKSAEHDGGDSPVNGLPFAKPIFYNVTSLGTGTNQAITFRDNTGGEYHNSLFINHSIGADIELVETNSFHSYRQFIDENLKLENNGFFNMEAGDLPSDVLKVNFK